MPASHTVAVRQAGAAAQPTPALALAAQGDTDLEGKDGEPAFREERVPWTGRAWILERRYKPHFNKLDQVAMSKPDGACLTEEELLDIERIAALASGPKNGNHPPRKTETPAPKAWRLAEDAADYSRSNDEALRLVLARVTAKASINELAGMISEIAEDQDLPGPLRNRVVKILSEFIPQRMK